MASSHEIKHVPISVASVEMMIEFEGFDKDIDRMIQWRLRQANFERDGVYIRRDVGDFSYNANDKVEHPPIPEDCPKTLDPNIFIEYQHTTLNQDPPMVPWQVLVEYRKKKLDLYNWVIGEIGKAAIQSECHNTKLEDKHQEDEDNEYSYAEENLVRFEEIDFSFDTMIKWRLLQAVWQKYNYPEIADEANDFNLDMHALRCTQDIYNKIRDPFKSLLHRQMPLTTDEVLVPGEVLPEYRYRKNNIHCWVGHQIYKAKMMRKLPKMVLERVTDELAIGGEETQIVDKTDNDEDEITPTEYKKPSSIQ